MRGAGTSCLLAAAAVVAGGGRMLGSAVSREP